MRSDSANRSEVSARPPGPAWVRVVVVAAIVTGVVAPMIVGLDWLSEWAVQTWLPGPPAGRLLGWKWVVGIAGASGLAVAVNVERRLQRGVRSPAGARPEGAAPDAEPLNGLGSQAGAPRNPEVSSSRS
jgi:hypothetical protein